MEGRDESRNLKDETDPVGVENMDDINVTNIRTSEDDKNDDNIDGGDKILALETSNITLLGASLLSRDDAFDDGANGHNSFELMDTSLNEQQEQHESGDIEQSGVVLVAESLIPQPLLSQQQPQPPIITDTDDASLQSSVAVPDAAMDYESDKLVSAVSENLAGVDGNVDRSLSRDEGPGEYVIIEVISQRQRKTIAIDPDYNVFQLKSMVEAKFQVDFDQICLIKDKRILNDDEVLRNLNLVQGSEIHLAIRYYPAVHHSTPNDESMKSWYWPSQYARLGLPNFDLTQLQEEMQKQFNENPELVREVMMNPMVQDMMSDPVRVKEMMLSSPGGMKLLEKRPDIAEALSHPKFMEETLKIAQDQGLLEETLSKMEANKDPNRKPFIPTFSTQEIPNSETIMKMMSQDSEILLKNFNSPYYKAMVEGMVANPGWTEKMLLNNPLLANNQQMRQQIKSFLPQFLNQLQSPDYIAMMSNPKALKSMMKIQQGITNLQQEAPNLTASMGFPHFAAPGIFNIEIEGDNDMGDVARANKGEVDPMSIMMGQIIRQTKEGTIDLPLEERYAKDLELMEQMGFNDRQTNLTLLAATFGDVNAAASQLLLQRQQ